MDNAVIPTFSISPEVRVKVAEMSRSVKPLLDDLVARYFPSADVRVIFALCKVKGSHGRARREALRELDRVVTDLFPSVEGAPLPSEELNGVADVLAGGFVAYDGAANAFGIGRYPSDYARFDTKF